jgi:hypothetical protein
VLREHYEEFEAKAKAQRAKLLGIKGEQELDKAQEHGIQNDIGNADSNWNWKKEEEEEKEEEAGKGEGEGDDVDDVDDDGCIKVY